jgi:hypothetical protein
MKGEEMAVSKNTRSTSSETNSFIQKIFRDIQLPQRRGRAHLKGANRVKAGILRWRFQLPVLDR